MTIRKETAGVTSGQVDVVVVGAGFAGLYMLQRLRQSGFSVIVIEAADDVGGTWYWNRYPGARCDIPTTDYTYSWDAELEAAWKWSEKYATQPEILSYLQFVADRYDLRRDIRFSTRVQTATWDDSDSMWHVVTSDGDTVASRWFVMATGCLSVPKEIDLPGMETFDGEVFATSRWPHRGVNVAGKRVGVIGTGSSGVQVIPQLASNAAELVVFQRTPCFSIPARNGPASTERLAQLSLDRDAYRTSAKWSQGGLSLSPVVERAIDLPEHELQARLERGWESGELFGVVGVSVDTLTDRKANDLVVNFLHGKVHSTVVDRATAEMLCSREYPVGTKRPCLDTGYFETFNQPHVRLVDLKRTPITGFTERGIETHGQSFDLDVIVLATGFDAMTGAIMAVDITGKCGIKIREKWHNGPSTYLGLMTVGFPNLFMVTGPGSPSVVSNMVVSIEQHVDWIAECLESLRERGFDRIEPTQMAEDGWVQHTNDCSAITLFPDVKSWYTGANVPGKPRVFMPYLGGVGNYRKTCDAVVEAGLLGFDLSGPMGKQCNDGVINRLQPDVAAVLDALSSVEMPAIESMEPEMARKFMQQANTARPAGPRVGEIIDGFVPAALGYTRYRMYRPPTEGPHPLMVYFHGGGWVLGDETSDDPLCRDLCLRADIVIVSVNYRHAPEDGFPAAVDDAYSALCWIADHCADFGGVPNELIVGGWSAGANLAAVVSHLARSSGRPKLAAQMLVNPVIDAAQNSPSYKEYGSGYMLTSELMSWFWNHYVATADRSDARCAPLLAGDLSHLPPAIVVTCECDPLRDEGNEYAEALAAAGVPVSHIEARGHTHTSLTMVDVVLSGATIRETIARSLKNLVGSQVTA